MRKTLHQEKGRMKLKQKQRLSRNRHGVSTLFISIYIALIMIILLSTIFFGIETTRTGTTQYLKLENERMQEKILVYGPGGMKPYGAGDSYIGSIRVNNTGSITVRIRAFYIGEKFICDPSEFQDTYIAAKEAKWLDLVPAEIEINDSILRVPWTIVTERGTKTSEIGGLVWLGKPGEEYHNTNEFYIGPLMMLFDKFQWRTGTEPWENGWYIPKEMNDVTWRIMLVDVDTRALTISDSSFFDLVLNSNEPKDIKWYINPNQEKTLVPWEYYYLEFSLGSNAKPQDMTGFTEGYTCTNFLTLAGAFADGAHFGQTIPFEAVLVTASQRITLLANPTSVRAGTGELSKSAITAIVTDGDGNPVPNQLVTFATTAGTLSSSLRITDNSGTATTTFTADCPPGFATISGEISGMSDSTIVTVTSVTTTLSLLPINGYVGDTVAVFGSNYAPNSQITIRYNGMTVANTVATTSGTIPIGFKFVVPASPSGSHTVSAVSSYYATATFTVNPRISISPSTGPTTAIIAVRCSGFAQNQAVTVTFAGNPVTTFPLTPITDQWGSISSITFPVPTIPPMSSGDKIVRVTDAKGNYDTTSFTLGTRTVALNPTSGVAGTTVTVSGTYYLPNSPIIIKFDGTLMTTVPATFISSELGTFSATFEVPTHSPGTYNVIAEDESINGATVEFTIANPSISISPNNGRVGTVIAITGSNFAPNSPITIMYNGQIAQGTTSTSSGTIPTGTGFIVTPSAAGNHQVTATDGNGYTATATFTVIPSITLVPSSAPKGTSQTISISGTGFASLSRITVAYAGKSFELSGTTSTDFSGSFSNALFTVNLKNNVGTEQVVITDSASNSATAIFTRT